MKKETLWHSIWQKIGNCSIVSLILSIEFDSIGKPEETAFVVWYTAYMLYAAYSMLHLLHMQYAVCSIVYNFVIL